MQSFAGALDQLQVCGVSFHSRDSNNPAFPGAPLNAIARRYGLGPTGKFVVRVLPTVTALAEHAGCPKPLALTGCPLASSVMSKIILSVVFAAPTVGETPAGTLS